MSQEAAVFIMMSNYFHDVATAMILACSVSMWLILKRYEGSAGRETMALLSRLYQGVAKLVVLSWIWIVAAGILRIATFSSYEWPTAVANHHEYGLMLKYGIAMTMMAVGAVLWSRAAKRMKAFARHGQKQ